MWNKECYKKYSVTVGTFFENSNIDLEPGLRQCTLSQHTERNFIRKLARDLNVHQKTAWFICIEIRGMVSTKHLKC